MTPIPPYRCPYCVCAFQAPYQRPGDPDDSQPRCPVCLHQLSDRAIRQAIRLASKTFSDVTDRWDRQAGVLIPKRNPGRRSFKTQSRLNRKRQRIYERDGHRCVECGTSERLTLDHIIPRSKGGTDSDDNLQTMCEPCNWAKADRMPETA